MRLTLFRKLGSRDCLFISEEQLSKQVYYLRFLKTKPLRDIFLGQNERSQILEKIWTGFKVQPGEWALEMSLGRPPLFQYFRESKEKYGLKRKLLDFTINIVSINHCLCATAASRVGESEPQPLLQVLQNSGSLIQHIIVANITLDIVPKYIWVEIFSLCTFLEQVRNLRVRKVTIWQTGNLGQIFKIELLIVGR